MNIRTGKNPSAYAECVGKLIERVGQMISNGECELSDDEMEGILHIVAHEKLYLPALEHKFNTTQRTIERWCANGTLPPLMQDELHRKFLWHDDIEIWMMSRKKSKEHA